MLDWGNTPGGRKDENDTYETSVLWIEDDTIWTPAYSLNNSIIESVKARSLGLMPYLSFGSTPTMTAS